MLFVYGTLQDTDVLGAVLGRGVGPAGLRRATAPGHRAVSYPGRVYPALVPIAGEAAAGLIVEGLTALDLAVLDAFEGDEYRRRSIVVELDGQLHPAEAYIPVIAIAPDGPAWSLANWTATHKPAVVGAETGTASALRQRLSAEIPG